MIFLILPAYNEEGDILDLLFAAEIAAPHLQEDLSIVVIDDGSTDSTVETVKSYSGKVPVQITSHPKNLGLGSAILTGIKKAVEMGSESDLAVFMDADNTHSPEYIKPIYEKIFKENLDVVIASRYAPGGKEIGVASHRKFLSHGAAWLYKQVFRLKGVRDYTCGYRGYRVSILKKAIEKYGDAFVTEKGFAAPGEILLKLKKLTQKFGEIPFELHYEKKTGPSKMPKFQAVLRNIIVLLKYH